MLERIDRYELKERIGAGGQATVYLGEDTLLKRTVAVKVLNQLASVEGAYVDAIMHEARLAAGLDHPNIATVYDFKVDGDYACIVMQYFPNSLDGEIRDRGPMSPDRAVDIAAQISDALSHSHARDIVHRDIKPHNILMDAQGDPKVTDFGIARATPHCPGVALAGCELPGLIALWSLENSTTWRRAIACVYPVVLILASDNGTTSSSGIVAPALELMMRA